MRYLPPILIILIIIGIILFNFTNNSFNPLPISFPEAVASPIPLSIKFMRSQNYPGSDIKIEQTLSNGSNYKRYIVSFYSEGLKEYAYMTIPNSDKPVGGFPVIIFNHGYQIPKLYTPEGNYIAYMDALARVGYIILKPDFRGNGKSQGDAGSTYFSPNYHIDDLNAISSVKKYKDVDPNKIGIWGHSMGGNITLRVSEISPDIKAAVIWNGVVGNYTDIIYNWQGKVGYKPERLDLYLRNLGLDNLLLNNGKPADNPMFWNSIDPTKNLNFIKVPVQIHVGLFDNQVPPSFSKYLYKELIKENKIVEYYEYPGDNHDINQSFDKAMQRTVHFFDKYLK